MTKNRLVVVGAGIAGLSAGVYACNAGFDVTVLEQGLKMRREMDVDQCLIFSMGVKSDLSACPHNPAFRLQKRFEYAGSSCAVVTSLLSGDMYDYWKFGAYPESGTGLPARVSREGGVHGPCSAVHRTAVLLDIQRRIHVFVEGGEEAGQRTKISGGLPVAVTSGREAVQYLCRDTGSNFVEQTA